MNSADEEIDLIPGGRHIPVLYEERHEYVERMIHARMTESNKQVFVSFYYYYYYYYYYFNNVLLFSFRKISMLFLSWFFLIFLFLIR